MRENSKKNMPDIMEAIFDAGYLIFDLIAGILFFVFSKGNPLFILYGVLTLTLCGGDAFPSGAKDHQSCPWKQREDQENSWESDYRYLRSR